METDGKSKNTRKNYGLAVRQLAQWLRANERDDDVLAVPAEDVRRWLTGMRGKVAEGELDVSPMENVSAPKVSEQPQLGELMDGDTFAMVDPFGKVDRWPPWTLRRGPDRTRQRRKRPLPGGRTVP